MRMIKYTIATLLVVATLMSCSKKTAVEAAAKSEPAPKGEHIQGTPSEGKTMVEDRLDQMIATIGLNEKKAAKFKAIEKKYQAKRLALRDEKIDQMAKLEKARSIMQMMDAEYKDLLSKEEYETYRGIMNANINTGPPE